MIRGRGRDLGFATLGFGPQVRLVAGGRLEMECQDYCPSCVAYIFEVIEE